ncbi:hemolymph clottable protein-like [Oratosquilla oratoria]|uniref:hemolymph clottable protein-like n=1 Tax=Oratosquilla oratoria TaxID=337810 RepID=UPI003F75F362
MRVSLPNPQSAASWYSSTDTMKTSLFLLACLGLASALQPGLEYEYVYHSRIATGIPEIQRQFAGAAIRASITVQLQGESLMAQMTHIEVADMNGLIECDSRAPLPLEYKILPGYDEILKKPFFINGTTSLVVSKSEPYWITNIRKAVATLFTVKPLRDHEQHDGLLQTEAFHTPALVVDDEQSLAGICQNRYILTKLPDYLKQEHLTYIEETVEEDVQWVSDQLGSLKSKTSSKNTAKGHKTAGQKGSKGSKGSKGGKYKVNVPKIGNDVYVLTKSVNFNECKEMVKFQNYGYGIYCKLGSSQCGTILSRSSTGSFYLRGSPDALRIERVEIEGNIIMNPLGYETEKIRTVTNQTLELKAVRFMGSHLEMPANTRHVDSFMYEVESTVSSVQTSEHPYVHHQQTEDDNTPGFYPTFIVSGLHTNQLTKAASAVGTQISRLLEEIWIDFKDFTLVEDEKKTDMAPRMNTIAELVMMLNYKELNTLFNSYDSGEDRGSFIRELLIDIMAMAGTDAPVRVLVEQIKNHNIGTERSAEVFMALSNSLQMPDHSIPRLIDLLKGLNINEDFQLTSSLILNLATAINRLCLVPQSRDTSQTNLLGQHYCHADSVLDEFLPLLENGLKEAQDVGHKFVYIHALTQMSTERKYNILKPIVLGNSETDYRVRSLACYAFQAYNSPKSFVPRVYHLMMPVFENQGEHFSVRMAAIGSLLSWEPDSAWWHRLAVASWRDLSRQMQSFISHLITSVAEMTGSNSQRQRAAHVLPMTKKFPASQRFSMTLLSDAYLEAIETGVILNTAWFHTVKSYIPVHYFQILIVKQGSFLNLLYELALDGHIDDLLYKTTKEPVNMRDPAARRAHNMYSQALMSLRMDEYTNFENYESTEPEHDGKFILSTRFFYNMRRIFMTGQNRDKMAHISNIPPSWTIVKYINPNQLFIAVPTDVGLPYIGKGSVPITFYSKGDLKLNTGPQIEVEAKLQTFASLQVQVTSEVVLPWNGIAVTSGIDVRRDVTLPVRVKALYDVNNFEGVLSVTPADQHEVSFVRHLNHPFTVRAPVVPNKPLMEQEDFKVIVQHKKLFQDQVSLGHEYTGMDVDLIWVGDIESPLNLPSALELLSYTPEEFFRVGLAPTLKNYEYKLNYHPTHSKTNTITFTFSATITEKSQKSYEQFTQNTGQFTGGQGVTTNLVARTTKNLSSKEVAK